MATKNCDLTLGGKLATFDNSSFSNQDNSQQQYRNLNLNAVHQSAAKIDNPVQAKSISMKNDERKVDDHNNSKDKNGIWNKNGQSQQNSLNLLNGSGGEEFEKQWKKKDATNDSTKNSSTLSLHIAAYENSVEAATNVADKEEDSSEKQLSKSSKKKAKLASTVSSISSTFISSPFEIPRQQTEQISEPEIMQFKTSQRLLNPNATGSSNQSNSNATGLAVQSIPDKKEISNEKKISESDYISRACLGRSAQIGDIYDVRTENLLHSVNIFNETKLPDDVITRIRTCTMDSVYTLSSKITDKYDKLDLNGELSVSVLAGLISGSGALNYINENVNYKEAVQCTFIQKRRTFDERININDKKLKGLVASDIGKFGGTHIVVGIKYGANAAVTMKYFNSKEESRRDINGRLKLAVSFLKAVKVEGEGQGTYNEKDLESLNEISLKVNADVNPMGCESPTNLKAAMDFISKFNQKFVVENDEGVQLELLLLPLEKAQEVFKFQAVYDRILCQLEMSTINRLGQFFDDIHESEAMLKSLVGFVDDNEEYIATDDKEAIKKFANDYDNAVSKVRGKLGALLPKIRSGEEEAWKIEHIREAFREDKKTSSPTICAFVDFYKFLKEKIGFLNDCQQKGVLMITETNNLARLKRNNPNTEIYMLFTAFKNDHLLPQWTENVKYFFDMQKQPGVLAFTDANAEASSNTTNDEKVILAVIDADVLPDIAKNELLPEGIRVAKYFNGRYIVEDCLELQRKMDSQCLVTCGSIKTNNKASIKAVPIDFHCPKSLGYGKCAKENKEWVCANCRQQIVYNFDGNFYCGCGYNSAEEFAFKCSHPMHGNDYVKPTKEDLDNFIKRLKPLREINLLVIGETGVGKSTWINALANYISHESIDDALKADDLINLIPIQFEINEKQNGEFIDRSFRVGVSDNEDFTKGQSATQHPKPYVFRHKNTLYRIIDTPGIGDVRGPQQDKKNMKNIMRFLASDIKQLHGICILMPPNESKLKTSFVWCFKRLLEVFHQSAVENIAFCFTNTSGYSFEVGQTLTPLRALLEEIKKNHNVSIPTSTERLYCFDNMAYPYLCAVKHYNVEYSPNKRKSNKNAYNNSRVASQKMLEYFTTRKPHNVVDSLAIYRARNVIRKLSNPLALINNAVQKTLNTVEMNQGLIKDLENDVPRLMKVLKTIYKETHWTMEYYDGYYCQRCQITKKYHGDGRKQFLTADPTAMDNDFYAYNVVKCLDGIDDKCPKCGTDTEAVFSKRWLSEKEEVIEKVNKSVEEQLEKKLKTRDGFQEEIQKVQQYKDELTAERDAIVKASARFAYFMKKYAFILTNDATESYLKQLIEENKGDELKKKGLEKLLNKYYAEKEILEKELQNASNFENKTITADDIMKTLENLKNLKHYGKDIAKVINSCSKPITGEAAAKEVVFEPPNQGQSSSFFGKIKKAIYGK